MVQDVREIFRLGGRDVGTVLDWCHRSRSILHILPVDFFEQFSSQEGNSTRGVEKLFETGLCTSGESSFGGEIESAEFKRLTYIKKKFERLTRIPL